MAHSDLVSNSPDTNLRPMSIKDILHLPPWNRKRRLEYYRIRKAVNKLLNDVRVYKATFKLRGTL